MSDIEKTLAERGSRYGNFMDHAIIAQSLKSVINQALHQKQVRLSPDMQEALEMVCHKIGRIINGDPNYLDSWVDIEGYVHLVVRRLQAEEQERIAKAHKADRPDLKLV